MPDNSGHITRAEAERMIAEALAAERRRSEAELQGFADEVSRGFREICRALDKAGDVIGQQNGYLVDLITLAVAEDACAGRLARSRPYRRRSSW